MTIDDDNSVYVGGLPYDATEDSVRRVFDLYGQVVAVKIINDHEVGGKCYGFVTFTNPRSAVDAISDMDGRTIDGRVVKVNEVKTRGMKSNFGRDTFQRNNERVMDLGRGRERGRNYDYDRERSRDRNNERSRDHDQERERGYDRARDLDQTRNRFIDRDRGRDQDRVTEDIEYERERNRGQELGNDLNLDQDHDREIRRTKNHQRSGNKDKDQMSKLLNSISKLGTLDYFSRFLYKVPILRSAVVESIHQGRVKEITIRWKNNWMFQIKSLESFKRRYLT